MRCHWKGLTKGHVFGWNSSSNPKKPKGTLKPKDRLSCSIYIGSTWPLIQWQWPLWYGKSCSMAPICANKSDRKSYMNETDGFSVLLTFPKPKANRSRKRRQFDDFSLLQGVASLRPIHSYKTACTTTRICSMCFAREENAITRKWQNQEHCPSIRRNMQALPPREEWPCCNGATKTDWKSLAGTQAKVQGLQKGARQLKSRKPLRKTQGQASFLDRRVRNMENRRGPLNRRIRRYSILQQLNFGDTSDVQINVFEFIW